MRIERPSLNRGGYAAKAQNPSELTLLLPKKNPDTISAETASGIWIMNQRIYMRVCRLYMVTV
ncbi:MAG: hypothetical protein LHW56_05220 [Candidatus Cloacimonetes bacterium]|jgi:hypothetical protein|nr:hypothetical protein [Candidatus Cloacimonadota bacterium]MDY0172288.1 hypothetical protein [Candidatus Cloacimonadaceae bacterium]